jgi:hypothetical protein
MFSIYFTYPSLFTLTPERQEEYKLFHWLLIGNCQETRTPVTFFPYSLPMDAFLSPSFATFPLMHNLMTPILLSLVFVMASSLT